MQKYKNFLKQTRTRFWEEINVFCEIFKKIIIFPNNFFKDLTNKRKYIIFLFIINFIIVLVKSFFISKSNIIFFEDKILDRIFSFLAIPQVAVIITYLSFFIFSIIFFIILKYSSRSSLSIYFYPSFLLSLMSISIIGIIAHIISFPLNFFEKSLVLYIKYIFYIWVIFLNIFAIYNTLDVRLIKIIFSLFCAFSPFLIFGWILVVSPYLIFLSIP